MDTTELSPGAGALTPWGWDERWAATFAGHAAAGRVPARVVAADQGFWHVRARTGEHLVTATGHLGFVSASDPTARPTVGDWVALAPAAGATTPGAAGDGPGEIDAVLARRTAIVRRAPAARGAMSQVLAANVDVVLIVTSLNSEFNLRRLERYLTIAWDSGATPVVLLSKADLADDLDGWHGAAAAVAPGVEIVAISAISGLGLDIVRAHLRPGRTAVLVGSSGVGKSTLVNAIAGHEIRATATIREDDARGRHTTTGRQLVPLADGLIIDTPGLRELGLADEDGLGQSFAEITTLASGCRFGDCAHGNEPGCAVRAAVAAGELLADRLASYLRLGNEARTARTRADTTRRDAERKRSAASHRYSQARMREKDGEER